MNATALNPDGRPRVRCLRRIALVWGVVATAPWAFGQDAAPPGGAPRNLQIYLLIGGPNMAGCAEIPGEADGVIDRCYLLDEKNEWGPARNPLNRHSTVDTEAARRGLGPGYAFAKRMLEHDEQATIGLVVNARDESRIDDWLGKSECYWDARRRVRSALSSGTLAGVLWHDGEGDRATADGHLEKLLSLVANLRSDFGDTSLPFVAGQIQDGREVNAQIARLAEATHGAAVVGADDLTAPDGVHFDARSVLLLGDRYAKEMLRLQAARNDSAARPPADIAFIDPHVHAMSVKPAGLRAVAQWMEDRNVSRCIVSPLAHKGSRPQNDEERRAMLEHFAKYAGRIDRMCVIKTGEVQTVDEAVAILQREIEDGAVGFGEHYGEGLPFDAPENLLLYEACERVGLPVMFHIDQNKNMVEPGMARVDRVLRLYPKCRLVAHAYWWRQLHNGTCDRQLREHPNLYADMSGAVVVNVLNRDRAYAREFLIRNQDKILWATDEGWWSFGKRSRQLDQHYTFFEELDLPDEVRRKIYRGNAEKVYGLRERPPAAAKPPAAVAE